MAARCRATLEYVEYAVRTAGGGSSFSCGQEPWRAATLTVDKAEA